MNFDDIKVGDTVVAYATCNGNLTTGRRYEVLSKNAPFLRVRRDDGAVDGFRAHNFEPAPAPAEPTLTVAAVKAALTSVYEDDPTDDVFFFIDEVGKLIGLTAVEVPAVKATLRFVD